MIYKHNSNNNFSYGGSLRNTRSGRIARPLSSRAPIHCVFKIQRKHSRIGLRSHRSFALIQKLMKKYSHQFFVKVEQQSVQGDHIHLLLRATRRSNFQSFFRVLAGQIAQEYQKQNWLIQYQQKTKAVTDTPIRIKKAVKLWKHRPFTRIVKGWRAYKIVRNYIQLNEKEFLGEIPYKKDRLRGLSSGEWKILWS